MQNVRQNPRLMRLILVGVLVLVVVCMLGVVAYRVFLSGDGQPAVTGTTPAAAPAAGEEEPTATPTLEQEPTATPTRVISGEGEEGEEEMAEPAETTPESGAEQPMATPSPTPSPSPTPAPTTAEGAADAATMMSVSTAAGSITDVLENGDFESGFDDQGVAKGWHSFRSGEVVAAFSAEMPGPYVKSGSGAQRISLAQAAQPDRYAGIYQPVEVAPGRVYTLELHGQIRSPFGDVEASSYGYRLQYAIDYTGGSSWQDIPAEDWVELDWGEQMLGSANVEFMDYTTQVSPTDEQLTVFIRAWNKWIEPGLAEYTLDSLSLIGPSPAAMAEAGQQTALDQPLPVTGAGDSAGLLTDGRFWGAVLILLLLAAGAIYRGRWGY